LQRVFENVTVHFIFTTSASYQGNFGGLSDADALCQSQADGGAVTGSLGATWIALLSDSTTNARDRVLITAPVHISGGVRVADNQADLWDNTIQNHINVDQDGNSLNNQGKHVWTGSHLDGTGTNTAQNYQCDDWTTSAAGSLGTQAHVDASRWFNDRNDPCNNTYGFYCITTTPVPGDIVY
jgi:hypothetical protein